MRSLLLVAHGSRREASNQEIRNLTAALAGRAIGRFGHVGCAFLEIARPSIPEAIEAKRTPARGPSVGGWSGARGDLSGMVRQAAIKSAFGLGVVRAYLARISNRRPLGGRRSASDWS